MRKTLCSVFSVTRELKILIVENFVDVPFFRRMLFSPSTAKWPVPGHFVDTLI